MEGKKKKKKLKEAAWPSGRVPGVILYLLHDFFPFKFYIFPTIVP